MEKEEKHTTENGIVLEKNVCVCDNRNDAFKKFAPIRLNKAWKWREEEEERVLHFKGFNRESLFTCSL